MTDEATRHIDEAAADERVSALLAAAAAPAEPGPQPGEAEALAAFRSHHGATRRSHMRSGITPLRALAASAVGTGLLLAGGVAAAATGSLPDGAQDTARELLAKVGMTVPGSSDDERRRSDDSEADSGRQDGHAGDRGDGKGGEVSELARDTDSSGVDKGAEVSDLASDGKSQAGDHGSSDAPDDREGPDVAPRAGSEHGDARPDRDHGDATADDAGEEASSDGTDKADDASGGQSGEGSGSHP